MVLITIILGALLAGSISYIILLLQIRRGHISSINTLQSGHNRLNTEKDILINKLKVISIGDEYMIPDTGNYHSSLKGKRGKVIGINGPRVYSIMYNQNGDIIYPSDDSGTWYTTFDNMYKFNFISRVDSGKLTHKFN